MRASGETTRCIDNVIQVLFNTGEIYIPLLVRQVEEIEKYGNIRGMYNRS